MLEFCRAYQLCLQLQSLLKEFGKPDYDGPPWVEFQKVVFTVLKGKKHLTTLKYITEGNRTLMPVSLNMEKFLLSTLQLYSRSLQWGSG